MRQELFVTQVAGNLDKNKDGVSNHMDCMEAFRKAGYTVAWRKVDPTELGIPVTRSRVHYIGWLRVDKSQDDYGPTRVENLTQLWGNINREVIQSGDSLLDLDSFLYGKWDDPSLQGVKSALIERHFLPFAQDENPSKRAKTGELAWPDMHKSVCYGNNVIWQQHFSMHIIGQVYQHGQDYGQGTLTFFYLLICRFHRSKIQIKGTVLRVLARIATMGCMEDNDSWLWLNWLMTLT